MALIIIKQRGLDTKSYPLGNGTLTIGRANDNTIVLANRYASGRHCEIRCEDGCSIIYDLDSTNGLFVNGTRVTTKALVDGDRILIGASMLIYVGDESSVDTDLLISRLKDGNSGEREIAANLLGQLGATAAAGPLSEILKEDPDTKVKAAAAEALGLLGDSAAGKILLAYFDTQDILLRNAVVRAIIRIADDKLAADVARFLKQPDNKVRVLAAYVLGQTHGSNAAKQLQKALRDESFEVREAAIKALGDLGDPLSVNVLLEIAREPHRYPLVWVIDSLGKIGHQKASPILIATLDHQNLEVKEAAIEALGRLRSKEAVPSLIELLDDSNANIRRSAARSLEKLRKFIEVERKLASAKAHETMEIAAVGERENTIAVGEPLYGEDRAAWEQWWSQQNSA